MTALRAHHLDVEAIPLDAEPAANPVVAPAAKTRPARPKAAVAPAMYTAEDIQILIGVSPITLDRLILAGEFPPPFTPKRKKRRWLRKTVDAWLDSFEAERTPRGRRR